MPNFNFCPYCGTKLQHEGARFCPGCGQSLTEGQGTTAPASSASQGSQISGTAVDPRGQPLPGAEIEVSGASLAGERQTFRAKSDSQGRYALLVPRGVYNVYAKHTVGYQGKRWRLRLHPTDENNDMVSAGPTPIVKDFQWRLTGLIPGGDPTFMESYYGGHIWIRCNSSSDRPVQEFVLRTSPESFVCTFTLTPVGPLIDGSAGTVLTMVRTVKALWSTEDNVDLENTPNLYDIPIGQYTMTAALAVPGWQANAASVPLNADGEEWQEAVDVSFEPNSVSWGTQQNIILIGLPD